MQQDYSFPLGIAAQNGYTKVVEKLLKRGAKANHWNGVKADGVIVYTLHCITCPT